MSSHGIFLSHSHHDKPFARRLASDLAQSGIRTWVDEAEMMVGDSLVQKISSAISEMEYVGAIISEHSVGSHWVQLELRLAMSREIAAGRVKVLPLLIDECQLPDFLQDKLYADFRNPEHYQAALEMLLRRLTAVPRLEQTEAPHPVVPHKAASEFSVDPRFDNAAKSLGVPASNLYSLPTNALLALLLRCCGRCKNLLFANWHDGNYMWDVFWNPLKTLIEPGLEDLLANPVGAGRKSFLERSLKTFNDALSTVTRMPHRVEGPKIVIEALGLWIATAEFALGEKGLAQKVFYGTYELFGLINSDNSICREAMREDFAKIADTAKAQNWTDTSPFSSETFWDYEWKNGSPAYFNKLLQQKVHWLTSFHKM